MKPTLDAHYWQTRYQEQNTPWDMGQVSPPLRHYIDQLEDKDIRILIPGAGRAYEAAYLHQRGFRHVYVCDWADAAFAWLRMQVPDFPRAHQLTEDFFDLAIEVDLIMEQTFFCAIDPDDRPAYAEQAADLLAEAGKLVGLFWATEFAEGPPYGGHLSEYRTLFRPYFRIVYADISPYSIPPRAGRELFLELVKKS